jgi:hypothetical protein
MLQSACLHCSAADGGSTAASRAYLGPLHPRMLQVTSLQVSTLLLGSGVNGEQQAGQKHKNLGLCHGTPASPLR